MYNPFKWHIINVYDKYLIRRLNLTLGWLYADKETPFEWFTMDHAIQRASFDDIASARKRKDSLKVEVI